MRDKVPPEVFTTPYTNPVGGNPEAVRANLREAMRLLKEAGYEVRDRKLVDARPASRSRVEFLGEDPSVERVVLFYKPSLERLGITVIGPHRRRRPISRTACAAGISTSSSTSWAESLSPGNEQREFWGSQAADQPGSRNLIGIKNPAVDALIDRVIFAKNRAELVAATKALDRVLLWNHYVVPQWTYPQVQRARALGPLQPCRAAAEIRPVRLPDRLVVGCRQGRQDRASALEPDLPRMALLSRRHVPRSRRRRAAAPRGLRSARRPPRRTPKRTACRCSAT